MKRILISCIISLILTLLCAEIFSIYNFGSIPTLLTSLYLISMFAIFEYFTLFIIYVCRKLMNKEKIKTKETVSLIILFIALLLILFFIIAINIDWLNWYVYSSPFYINVIFRSVEFLLPATILIVISVILLKKQN